MGVLSRLTSMIRRALASVSYPLAVALSRIILARVYPYAFMNLLYYNVQRTYRHSPRARGGVLLFAIWLSYFQKACVASCAVACSCDAKQPVLLFGLNLSYRCPTFCWGELQVLCGVVVARCPSLSYLMGLLARARGGVHPTLSPCHKRRVGLELRARFACPSGAESRIVGDFGWAVEKYLFAQDALWQRLA